MAIAGERVSPFSGEGGSQSRETLKQMQDLWKMNYDKLSSEEQQDIIDILKKVGTEPFGAKEDKN